MIYELLLTPAGNRTILVANACSCSASSKTNGPCKCKLHTSYKDLNTAILRTNRQIHDEAVGLLFNNARMRVEISPFIGAKQHVGHRMCEECDETEFMCLSEMSLSFVAKFRKISVYVKMLPCFPHRQIWRATYNLLKRFQKCVRDENKKTGLPLELTFFWGFNDALIIPCPHHSNADNEIQEIIYKYRRVSALIEPADWLFDTLDNVKFYSERAFTIQGFEISELESGEREQYTQLTFTDNDADVSGIVLDGIDLEPFSDDMDDKSDMSE